MDGRMSLGALGVGADEERVYRTLLMHGPGTSEELALASHVSLERVGQLIRALEDMGLAAPGPGGASYYVPVPPDVALEALVSRRGAELDHAREAVSALAEEFRAAATRPDPLQSLEIISGRDAVARLYEQIKRGTEKELLLFDKAPYSALVAGSPTFDLDVLERGASMRVLYDRNVIDLPGHPEFIDQLVAAGEEARMGDPPCKLVISDDRLAMLPLVDDGSVTGCLLVHPSSLLDALLALFEVYWERSTPLHLPDSLASVQSSHLAPEDRRMLALLAGGMKDDAIARQLRIGLRTLRRRVSALMDELGADTRFQAGAAAAKRGWLGTDRRS